MKTKKLNTLVIAVSSRLFTFADIVFKFTAAPESVYIFTKLGMEPWGRIGSGIVELIAAILILIPRTTAWGAALAIGVISGALFFHLTTLGIVVLNDNGLLFVYALVVWICNVILLIIFRIKY